MNSLPLLLSGLTIAENPPNCHKFTLNDHEIQITTYQPSKIYPFPEPPVNYQPPRCITAFRSISKQIDFKNPSTTNIKALYIAFKVVLIADATSALNNAITQKIFKEPVKNLMDILVLIPTVCDFLRDHGLDEMVFLIEEYTKALEKFCKNFENKKISKEKEEEKKIKHFFIFILFQLYLNLYNAYKNYDEKNNAETAHVFFSKVLSLFDSLKPEFKTIAGIKSIYETVLFSNLRHSLKRGPYQEVFEDLFSYIESTKIDTSSNELLTLLQELSTTFSRHDQTGSSLFCQTKIAEFLKASSDISKEKSSHFSSLDAIINEHSHLRRSHEDVIITFDRPVPTDFKKRLENLLPRYRSVTIGFVEESRNMALTIKNIQFMNKDEFVRLIEKVDHFKNPIPISSTLRATSESINSDLPESSSAEMSASAKIKIKTRKPPVVSESNQEKPSSTGVTSFTAQELNFNTPQIANEPFYLCRQRTQSSFSLYVFAGTTTPESMRSHLQDAKIAYKKGDNGFKWDIGYDRKTGQRISIPYYKSFKSGEKKIRYYPMVLIRSGSNLAYGEFEAVQTKSAEGKKQSHLPRQIEVLESH